MFSKGNFKMLFPTTVWRDICEYLLYPNHIDRRYEMMTEFKNTFRNQYKSMSMKFVSNEHDGENSDDLLYQWVYSNDVYLSTAREFIRTNTKYQCIKSMILPTVSIDVSDEFDNGNYLNDYFGITDRYVRACERIINVITGGKIVKKLYYDWYVPNLVQLLNNPDIGFEFYRFNLYKKMMFNMFLNRRFMYFSEHQSFTDFDVSRVHLNMPCVVKKRPLILQRFFQGYNTIPTAYALNHIGANSEYVESYDDSNYFLHHHLQNNFFIPITEEELTVLQQDNNTDNDAYATVNALVCDDMYQAFTDPTNVRIVTIPRSYVYSST